MTYITLVQVELNAEQQTQLDNYITTAMVAGNTNGIKCSVQRVGVLGQCVQREWNSDTSASDSITFLNTLATPSYAVVVAPLVP